jgi:propanol-preferring alcohol dehydrogenase
MTAQSEIPSKQQVALIIDQGPKGYLEIRDGHGVQQPGENEVLVKLECSGICHSDCHNVEGRGQYTDIPGHEGVGTVVKLGSGASESLLGKRVGVKYVEILYCSHGSLC